MTQRLETLPAGKYWVGDLCYVLDDPIGFDWGTFVDWMYENDPTGREHEGPHTYKGIHLSYHGTAYGDGCYPDQHGHSFGVDAGIIGCVRAEDIGLNGEAGREINGGHVIEFKKPFTTSYDDGTITIGHLEIPTEGDEDEEDWVEYCEECGTEEQYHDGLCNDCYSERE